MDLRVEFPESKTIIDVTVSPEELAKLAEGKFLKTIVQTILETVDLTRHLKQSKDD